LFARFLIILIIVAVNDDILFSYAFFIIEDQFFCYLTFFGAKAKLCGIDRLYFG